MRYLLPPHLLLKSSLAIFSKELNKKSGLHYKSVCVCYGW